MQEINPVIVDRDRRLIFIQAPQTGSTAVGKELCEVYGCTYVPPKHAFAVDALSMQSDKRGWVLATSTRDPYAMAVSDYYKVRNAVQDGSVPGHLSRRSVSLMRKLMRQGSATLTSYLYARHKRPAVDLRAADRARCQIVLANQTLAADFRAMLEMLGADPVRELPLRNVTKRTPERERPNDAWIEYIFGPQRRSIGHSSEDTGLSRFALTVSKLDFTISQWLILKLCALGCHPAGFTLRTALRFTRAPFVPFHFWICRLLSRSKVS
jgi:hypothetical protein